MVQELMYTSAPRGLRPGTRGFCTVAATRGMSPVLMEKLESLSGYRALFPPNDPRASANPVAFSHVRINVAGKAYSVLSRVCAAGLDYSERSNKFAHHLVLQAGEMPRGGPAWLMQQPNVLAQTWNGAVQWLAPRTPFPAGDSPLTVCHAWQGMTGDAGWAGVVAESLLKSSESGVCVIFQPGTEILPLVGEVLSLLPVEQRWGITFSTYSAGLPQGLECRWRCYAAGTVEAKSAVKAFRGLVLSLTADLGTAKGGALVERARTGRAPEAPIALPAEVPEAFAVPAVETPRPFNLTARAYAVQNWCDETAVPDALAGTRRPPPLRTNTVTARRSRRRWLVAAVLAASVLLGTALYVTQRLGRWPWTTATNTEVAVSLPAGSDTLSVPAEAPRGSVSRNEEHDRPKSSARNKTKPREQPSEPHTSGSSGHESARSTFRPPNQRTQDDLIANSPSRRDLHPGTYLISDKSSHRTVADYLDIPQWSPSLSETHEKLFPLPFAVSPGSTQLSLEGLPSKVGAFKLRFDQDPHRKNKWSLISSQSEYVRYDIATFTLENRTNLLFTWKAGDKNVDWQALFDQVRTVLSNCVLTVTNLGSQGCKSHYALRAPLACSPLVAQPPLTDDPAALPKDAVFKCLLKGHTRSQATERPLSIGYLVVRWRDSPFEWKQATDEDQNHAELGPNFTARRPFRVEHREKKDPNDATKTLWEFTIYFERLDSLDVALTSGQRLIEIRPRTTIVPDVRQVPFPLREFDKLPRPSKDLKIEALVLYMRVNGIRVDVYRIGSSGNLDSKK